MLLYGSLLAGLTLAALAGLCSVVTPSCILALYKLLLGELAKLVYSSRAAFDEIWDRHLLGDSCKHAQRSVLGADALLCGCRSGPQEMSAMLTTSWPVM